MILRRPTPEPSPAPGPTPARASAVACRRSRRSRTGVTGGHDLHLLHQIARHCGTRAWLRPRIPTIVTVASAGGPLGTVLTDDATLSGGMAPTGSITFRAVRSERCHLREPCDLHVERDPGGRQRHLYVGAGLHTGGGGDLSLARVLQRRRQQQRGLRRVQLGERERRHHADVRRPWPRPAARSARS